MAGFDRGLGPHSPLCANDRAHRFTFLVARDLAVTAVTPATVAVIRTLILFPRNFLVSRSLVPVAFLIIFDPAYH